MQQLIPKEFILSMNFFIKTTSFLPSFDEELSKTPNYQNSNSIFIIHKTYTFSSIYQSNQRV